MHFQLAETPGESDVLRAGDVLIAKEDDLVQKQRSADLRDRDVVEVLCQIDARNLATDDRRDRRNRNLREPGGANSPA